MTNQILCSYTLKLCYYSIEDVVTHTCAHTHTHTHTHTHRAPGQSASTVIVTTTTTTASTATATTATESADLTAAEKPVSSELSEEGKRGEETTQEETKVVSKHVLLIYMYMYV